ncbi:zinc finger CCCH domain-containing protein 13-like [Anopheles bellator]|uniref:zinc finger CCCH domain-containing protein 13-like n=1 Tax=Anopheles bellator TaxID=139047 RepID=UPI002649668E|nr:zinc finger CCCH domain-containing protein 13-like [Anopheles bellator]
MGKDSVREKDTMIGGCGGRKSARPVSASPYSENYRPPMDLCQRHLINHRLLVSKLTRRELEDKYIVLCDENYSMKKRVHEQEDLIKRLKTKLMRASSESNCRSKSRLELGSNEHYNRLHDLESQRRELHEKLEALRRATSSDIRRMDSVTGGAKPTGTRHTSGAVNSQSQHRRSKSAAHRAKDREPSRCKSSSPSNDDYEEHSRVRDGPSKDRRSTDRDDDDDEDDDIEEEVEDYANGGRARSAPRKSYGADDEDEGEDDEDRDRDREDQDRDVASCTGVSEENGDADQRSASGASGGGTRNAKLRGSRSRPSTRPVGNCADCERHHNEQLVRETDIVKMKLNIKYLHKELQNEKEKSALLARQLEERLSYEIMKRNAAENIEILNLNRQVEDMTRELQRQVDEQRRSMEHEMRKQGDLEAQIRKEKDKNSELFEECERLKKSIEKLKENMSEVEIERDFLKRQQENFTKIVDENKLLKYQLDDLRKHNQGLLKQIDTLKEEELVTRASQKELLEKLKTLQQDNDTLSVMLEGLRTENEVLAEEKTLLEQSLKSLEASPIRERLLTPTPPLSSPQKPLLADVCIQTELENLQTVSDSVVFDPDRALASSKIEPQTQAPRSSHASPKRSSLKSSRNGGELAAQEMAPTTQQLLRQVTVGHTIPKLSRILDNRIEERHKPSNVELLLMNSYPAELEKSFRRNERFRTIQSSFRKRETTDRGSIVSSGSDRRKISFAESSATDESPTKDDEDPESVERNYASLFGFGRQPSMWHSVVNPQEPAPEVTNPRHESDRLTIEIQSVRWHESAIDLLQTDGVSVYYVEFRFLDLHGHQLETPASAPLVTDTTGELRLQHDFHFQAPIELDPKRNPERCKQLKAMLGPEGRDVLQFVLVNERQDCEDIGYATVRLRSELTEGCHGNAKELLVRAPIYDFRRDHDEMGVLTVKFENVKIVLPLVIVAQCCAMQHLAHRPMYTIHPNRSAEPSRC